MHEFKNLLNFDLEIKDNDVILVEIPAMEQKALVNKAGLILSKSEAQQIQKSSKTTIPFLVANVGSSVTRVKRGDIVYITNKMEGVAILLNDKGNFWETPNIFFVESIISHLKKDSDLYQMWARHFDDSIENITKLVNDEKGEQLIRSVKGNSELKSKNWNDGSGITGKGNKIFTMGTEKPEAFKSSE